MAFRSVPRHTGVVDHNTDSADTIIDPPFLHLAARDRVTVAGPDASSYLHSQIAQDIRELPVGGAAWTLVLEPNGKVDSLARVTRAGDDTFVFDIDAGFGEVLTARLRRFKIRVDAEIELEPADDGAGVSPEDENDRIAAGWPKMGAEIVPGETIPAVSGVTGVAVNFTKGCYPGQELVERMDSRGAEAPSSLRVLTLGVDVPVTVTPGAAVVDESGTAIGVVTSVGSTMALATIKRGHTIGSAPAHVAPPS
jgi:tRNA-modifying protein YgfZ